MINICLLILTLFSASVTNPETQSAETRLTSSYPQKSIPDKAPWRNRVRVETLKNLDEFLNWSLRQTGRTYALADPLSQKIYHDEDAAMQRFVQLHGFFSLYQPLVGRVTAQKVDVESTRDILRSIADKMEESSLKKLATNELLAKVLAYRDLHMGDLFVFSALSEKGEAVLNEYQVDEVFNLWLGMPAFGLIPKGNEQPILLFRGTDFSLDSHRGWASLMSDVDLSGPGLYAFQKAQTQIHAWLEKVVKTHGKARVLGYSLGGALAAYTYIFENPLMSHEGSYAFNAPGLSDPVIQKWEELSEDKRQGFVSFVNRGDVVSKVGKLFGRVYELSGDTPMKPLTAHTQLMSAQKVFYQANVDVAEENRSRQKK